MTRPPLKIESASNETFRRFLSLTTAKGLKKENLFLLSGEKLVREFLKKPTLPIAFEIVDERLNPLTNAKVTALSQPLFEELDIVGTHFNILVLEQPVLEAANLSEEPIGFELILPIGDPANLGALLRSCEAFGVQSIVLTSEAAHPFLPKAVKASAGSVLRLPLKKGPSLSELPHHCIALDDDGVSIEKFEWPKNCRLVVGEEGPGLKNLRFQQKVSIPTQGVESLNVVVAASIALYLKNLQ